MVKDINSLSTFEENLKNGFSEKENKKIMSKTSVPGYSDKQIEIEQMSIDLLYLHAIFYVKMFKKIESDELKESCDKLQKKFKKIDEIFKLKGENHNLDLNSDKAKAELDCLISFFLNTDETNDKDKIEYNKEFISLEDYCKDENDFEKLKEDLIPTCYGLKNKICEQLSEYVYNNEDRDYEKKLKCIVDFNYGNEIEKDETSLKYIGECEELISKNKKLIENNTYLKIIKINREIRDILGKYWIFGVNGKKKCGKSTFIEKMIPGANANANSLEPTTIAKAYIIDDKIIMIDDLHCDSKNDDHKLQFIFSRHFLDHNFLVFNAMERMDSDASKNLFNLIKSNNNNKHFTIILNKSDQILIGSKETDDKNDITVNLKNEVCERLKLNTDDEKALVVLACLDSNILEDKANLEKLDEMKKTTILFQEDLKKHVYEIIENTVPKENTDLRNKLEKFKTTSISSKNILLINKNKKSKYILSKDKNIKNDQNQVIYSYKELLKDLNEQGITNPQIQLKKGDSNIAINDFNDFFSNIEHCYHVINENKNFE